MNMKKIVAVASALSLTAAVTVGGTLAWLQKETGAVTNTFTYSKDDQEITLELLEGRYHPDGDNETQGWVGTAEKLNVGNKEAEGVTSNTGENGYKIVPGAKAPKTPTLFIKTGSDTTAYLFAKVVEEDGSNLVTVDMNTEWKQVTGADLGLAANETLYVYEVNGVGATDAEKYGVNAAQVTPYEVFGSVTYANVAPAADARASINVYGYAVDVNAGATPADAFIAAGFGTATNQGD